MPKFIVYGGNNPTVIKNAILQRGNWEDVHHSLRFSDILGYRRKKWQYWKCQFCLETSKFPCESKPFTNLFECL